jgi:uncharacterized SAM-binding protein YcdF (DUF218 family)
MRKAPKWAVLAALAGLPVWCGLAIFLDVYGHRPEPEGRYDAIVVAGCRVMPNGLPSLSLVRRTTRAVELWRRGLAPTIVLTGGIGDFPPAESEAAAAVARGLGVPETAMLLERKSTSTAENARYLRALVDFNRIIVVTDSFHVRRCEWFFGKYFQVVRGVGVLSPWQYRARGAFREALAFAYYVVFPRRI